MKVVLENNRMRMRRKALSLAIRAALASTLVVFTTAHSEPQGGDIIAGSGSITSSTGTTTIQQNTQGLVIDWDSFNLSTNESVIFNQPSSSAAALNRIFDQLPSDIRGSIEANGLIFLMNPNGVIFGETSRVEVGGLVATSLNVDADLFMDGIYKLQSNAYPGGLIINRGLISASTGGVSLISDSGVINEGKILATSGSINLATATAATLDFDGDKLLLLTVDGEVIENSQSLESAIDNSGEIVAEGGEVLLSGQAARDVFSNVVNNSGMIKATRIEEEGGVIRLVAGDSVTNTGTLDVSGNQAGDISIEAATINVSGTLDASSTGGDGGNVTLTASGDNIVSGDAVIKATSDTAIGGSIKILGYRVGLIDNATVDASGALGGGEVLIGGDYQGINSAINNAAYSYVGENTSISADALQEGDGGKVIVWSDKATRYHGSISVKGGSESGDGGFVEVSGKEFLQFDGAVDVSTANGQSGTLLLDPQDITIVDAGGGADDAVVSGDNEILFGDPDGATDYTISETTLEGLNGNVILQAQRDIIIGDLATDGVLDFSLVDDPLTESVVFQAGRHITFTTTSDTLQTGGGNIHLEADSPHSLAGAADGTGDLTLGILDSNGGDITLLAAGGGFTFSNTIDAGAGDISISTSDNTAIDLLNDITQTEYDLIATTGTLSIGKATDAGSDGVGTAAAIQYASSLTIGNDITIAGTSAGLLSLYATNGFTVANAADLIVNQNLVIDVDADGNSTGTLDIEGQIQAAGSESITINANIIEGDNDTTPNTEIELVTTGAVDLTATEIGINDRPINISAASLTITDTGTGDVEINLNAGTAVDIGVSSNDIDASNLNTLTDFTYINTYNSVGIGTISAAGKNITIDATNGITDATSSITAANLTLTANGTDSVIGANGSEINTTLSGSLTASANTGTGGIYVSNTGALDVASIDTGTGDLELTATTNITDSGTITVGGAATFTVGDGNDITLDDVASAFNSTVTFVSAGTLNNVTFVDTTAYDVQAGGLTVGGNLDIIAAGITQTGDLTVTGTSSFDAGANVITLTNVGNDFTGAVSLSNSGTNNVAVTDSNGIDLGTVTVGTGTFDITTVAGDITDSGTQSVGGAATFTVADAANIVLDDASNAYSSTVTFTSGGTLGNVTFVDTTAYDVQAGGLTVGGNLAITATGITQTGDLTVTGTSAFGAGANAITLTNTTNDFTGAVSLSNTGANNVAITDSSALDLGAGTFGQDLTVTAAGITQSGTLAVTGNSSFTVSDGSGGTNNNYDIVLDDTSNAFTGTVTFAQAGDTLQNVTLVDTTAYDVQAGGLSITGNLDVTTAGITQTGDLTITGTSSFAAGANAIDLSNAGNDFTGAVSLSNSGANNVAVTDTNNIDLGTVTVGTGTLDITSGGSITDSGTLTVSGAATFTAADASDIILDDASNAFSSTLNFESAGTLNNVTLVSTTAYDVQAGGLTVGGNIDITAAGITQTGDLTVTGTSAFDAGANAIDLTNAGNDFTGAVSLNNTGANNVAITDTSALDLAAGSFGGNLTVSAAGISQSGALSVTGTSSFTAGTNNIDLSNAGNDFTGAVSLSNSGATSAVVVDTNAIDLGTVSVTDLDVTAIGITQSGVITVTGTASFDAGAGVIDLTNAGNDFTGAVSLSNTGANNVAITDSSALDLAAGSFGANLTVTAAGITQSGALLVTGTSTFNAGANAITLTDTGNDFTGAVSLNNSGANNVAITDSSALDLGAGSFGQDLTVTAAGITQSGALTVAGNSSFTVSDGNGGTNNNYDITLDDAGNDFTGSVNFAQVGDTLRHVTLVDTSAYDVQAGGLSIAGNLDITAAGITQTGGALTITGTSTFDGGSNAIVLTDGTNNFTGAVSLNTTGANNASVSDANAIDLGASNVGGDMTVVAGTSITDLTGATVTVGGDLSLTANGAGGAIGSAVNTIVTDVTGVVNASATNGAGGVYISDLGALAVGAINANTGVVELTAVNAITDAAGADTTVDVTASSLTLDSAGSGVSNADALNVNVTTLSIVDAGADDTFYITEAGGLTLGDVTVGSIDLETLGGDLDVRGNITTNGDITLRTAPGFSLNILDDGVRVFSTTNVTGGGFVDEYFTDVYVYGSVTLDTNNSGDITLVSDDIAVQTGSSSIVLGPNFIGLHEDPPLSLIFHNDYFQEQDNHPAAVLDAGVGNSVIFDTATAANTVTVGTMLTQAEINTIAAAGAVQFGTATNTGGVQLTANINTSAYTDTVLLTSGSITTSAGANTLTADSLSLTADTGIGSAPTPFGLSANSLSAVNNTSGDIYLGITGNVSLGGVGTITNNVADSTIGISATGNLVIDADFSVPGNGTIALDAGGTITRTAGTVTANTVELGLNTTPTSIGAMGTPVILSSSNISAQSTGDIYLQNDTAVNLTLSAGGNAEFVNTSGAISSVAAQAINATGNLTLRADDMEFVATSTISGANINLYTQTSTADFLLGDNTDSANQVELAEAELQTLSSSGTVAIGENGVMTGDIIMGGNADLSGETFSLTLATEGDIDANSAGNTLSLAVNPGILSFNETLTLDASSIGTTNAIETSADSFVITSTGVVNIDNSVDIDEIQINAGTGDVTLNNAGYLATTNALSAGSFNMNVRDFYYLRTGSSMTSGVGDISISVQNVAINGDFIAMDNGTLINATGDVLLTANEMIFDCCIGTSTITGANITIAPYLASNNIVIGSTLTAGSDTGGADLDLNAAELAMLDSTGTVTIGGVGYTGDVFMGESVVNLSAENFDFTVTTTGRIDDITGGGNPIILNTGKVLSLNAGDSIGFNNAITFTADSVSAVNTAGALLQLAPTGNISLGTGGTTIDQQEPGGTLSVVAGGNIDIAGDITVSGGGTSTINLDANGTITRSGGTIIAETINLGQNGTTTSIGTGGSHVLVDGAFLDIDSTGDVFVDGVNTTSTTLRGSTNNLTFDQTGTGDLALGNISSGNITISTTGGSNIEGVAAETVQGTNIDITSDGSIGATTQLRANAITTLALTSNGNNAGGDISVNILSSPFPTLTANGTGTQTLSIAAPTHNVGTPFNLAGDNLLLESTVGGISLGANITANELYLVSNTGVTQGAGVITAGSLLVRSVNNVTLGAANDVDTIAANVTGGGASFTFNDVDDLSIGTVTGPGVAGTLNGISTNGGAINITTGGALSQTVAGVINGSLLTTTSSGGTTLGSNNTITNYNGTDLTGGNIVITDSGSLNITGISTTGNATITAGSLTDSGTISANLLTTTTTGSTVLNNANTITSFNGTSTSGGSIVLVDSGSLDITGISTTGNVGISTGNITSSGSVSANNLSTSTSSGVNLSNAGNNVASFTANDSGTGNITLVDTGSLAIQSINSSGAINISTSGNITQTSDIKTSSSNNINVTTTGGTLTMNNSTTTSTNGGAINYTSTGDLTVSLLNASAQNPIGTTASSGSITLTSTAGDAFGNEYISGVVRADTVTINAFNIGENELKPFVFSNDITGSIILNYFGNAFIVAPLNASVTDLGSGLVDASGARSAGSQRGQSTGLEEVGFIDLALFSDINLFVIEGNGVELPSDQSDVEPSEHKGVPANDEDEEKRKRRLDVSLLN